MSKPSPSPVSADGWSRYSIWDHTSSVHDLYIRRARMEAEEMTCAAQAAEILQPLVDPGDTLLDVGCGTGWFFHSLRTRGIDAEYWGIDASTAFIATGRREMPAFGLPPERLQVIRLEDLAGAVDHVVCMNVLSNVDNFHRPLERLAHMANKTLVLRESLKSGPEYAYVRDHFLDDGCDLRVHVNAYDIDEVAGFITDHGFDVSTVVDRRSGGAPEMVIGHPHYWTFLVARRR